VAFALPLAALGQQPANTPRRIAVLSPVRNPLFEVFRVQLRKLGYAEGRDIWFDFRIANAHINRLPVLAEELVSEGVVDAIIAESTPAAVAASRATKTIPIIAYIAVDPVAAGLAESLARPGRNVTGISFLTEELNAKRVELFHEIFPLAKRLAAIATTASSRANSPGNLRALQDAARELGLTVDVITVGDPARLRRELEAASLAGFDGFILLPDIVLTAHTTEVIALLEATGKPTIYNTRMQAEAGGLISYGQDSKKSYERLASQLDQVLRGTAPNGMPFERPTKFELVINPKTAKALGLTIPPSLLARADEVIE
jgi:ABC-type uncharacterized transport system substrate-binding protein